MLGSVFVYCALFGGIFLLLQMLMMFVGGDHGADAGHMDVGFDGGDFHGGFDGDVDAGFDGDMDAGVDGDVDVGQAHAHGHSSGSMFFEVFSLRTVAAAVTFFGLVGMAVHRSGGSDFQATAFGVIAGVAALYGLYWVFKQLFRLQSSGNQDIRNALGVPASVYVPIPADNQGRGKVQFEMQGRIVEYQAVTDDAEKLATGESVYVRSIVDADTVLVSRAVPDRASSSA